MEGRHSEDHGALGHPAHCPHRPLTSLGQLHLPGLPASFSPASALPGEHFADRPQGPSQVLTCSDMGRGKSWEAGGVWMGEVHGQQGSWESNC